MKPTRFFSIAPLLLTALLTAALGGCASAQKAPTDAPPEAMGPPAPTQPAGSPSPFGPPEPFGPPMPPAAPAYGPDPVLIKPVVLVLGPGGARAFAHAGVIRALVQSKIRISAVLGTEMGALVGALYASDRNANHMEWGLARLRAESFAAPAGFLSKVFAGDGGKLEADLNRALRKRDIAETAIPLRIALQKEGTREVVAPERGPLSRALRAALALPGRHAAVPLALEGRAEEPYGAAVETRPFLTEEARAFAPAVVVAVEVAEAPSEAAAEQLKHADLVIRPDLAGIGEQDHQKRTDAIFRGKQAAQAQLRELRRLIGLSEGAQAAGRSDSEGSTR